MDVLGLDGLRNGGFHNTVYGMEVLTTVGRSTLVFAGNVNNVCKNDWYNCLSCGRLDCRCSPHILYRGRELAA